MYEGLKYLKNATIINFTLHRKMKMKMKMAMANDMLRKIN